MVIFRLNVNGSTLRSDSLSEIKSKRCTYIGIDMCRPYCADAQFDLHVTVVVRIRAISTVYIYLSDRRDTCSLVVRLKTFKRLNVDEILYSMK